MLVLLIVTFLPQGLGALLRASISCWIHWDFLVEPGSATSLTRLFPPSTSSWYDSWKLSIGSTVISSGRLLLISILR